MYLNAVPRVDGTWKSSQGKSKPYYLDYALEEYEKYPGAFAIKREREYGWPWVFFSTTALIKPIHDSGEYPEINESRSWVNTNEAASSIAAMIGILIIVGVLSEVITRKRIKVR
jgi:hypothetical protein